MNTTEVEKPQGRGLSVDERLWCRRRLRFAVEGIDTAFRGKVRRDILARIVREAADDLEQGRLHG